MIAWRRPARWLATLVVVVGCSDGPPAIAWGTDDCDFCRMTITDQRYAAAAITATGRTVHFDAIECLAGWMAAQPRPPRTVWVTDITHPGTLIPAAAAQFYRTANGHSPMGRGLVAVGTTVDSVALKAMVVTGPLTWDEVRELVRREGAIPLTAPGGVP